MTLRRKVKLYLLSEQKIDMTRAIFSICTFTNVLISMFHVVTPAASNLAFFPLFFLQLDIDTFHRFSTGCPICLLSIFFCYFFLQFVLTALSLSSSVSVSSFFLCYPNVYTSIYTEKSLCIQGKGLKETDKKMNLKTHST